MWIFPKDFSVIDGDVLYSNRPINSDLIVSFDAADGIESVVEVKTNENSGHHVVHEVPAQRMSLLSKFPSIEFMTSIIDGGKVIKLYWLYKSVAERDDEMKMVETLLKK